jgi:hypothetical protein
MLNVREDHMADLSGRDTSLEPILLVVLIVMLALLIYVW